jgi:ATP-dependent DNA helicase DinG
MPMIVHNLDPHLRNEVYVQSKEDPASLKADIEEFRQNGNAILVGVRSLWTGLDVPGPALRTVIIWKLPYGVPTLEWKAIQRVHGRDVYFDSMLMVLTQGIGRLVRSTEDAGLVFIADSRASTQRWRANGMTRHLAEFSK